MYLLPLIFALEYYYCQIKEEHCWFCSGSAKKFPGLAAGHESLFYV
jgi:hypothetical protein